MRQCGGYHVRQWVYPWVMMYWYYTPPPPKSLGLFTDANIWGGGDNNNNTVHEA
jgi:hypothetical protein